jgi:hypothetical protein
MAAGCAQMTTQERAQTAGGFGSEMVLSLHQQYDAMILSETISAADKEMLVVKVAPVLDQMKRAQIKYNKAVIAWVKSGDPQQPAAIGAAKGQYETLFTEATSLMAGIMAQSKKTTTTTAPAFNLLDMFKK